jgi:hypothetical protein
MDRCVWVSLKRNGIVESPYYRKGNMDCKIYSTQVEFEL